MTPEYLSIIKSTFVNHEISKIFSVKLECFNCNKKYPNSEGISFESDVFIGEIFMYFGTMKYMEAQFLLYKNGKDHTLIKDKPDKKEIPNEIIKFLNERLKELKS